MERQFNKIEGCILKVLFQQKLLLTAYEVARDCNISYPTAKKYLNILAKERYISKVIFKNKKRVRYIFNFAILHKS